MLPRSTKAPSRLEYHLLLALAERPLHGYLLAETIEEESGGALVARAGSLYRVIARLMAAGLLVEVELVEGRPNPGLPRREYALTAAGRKALTAETRRLERTAAVARHRLGLARGRP
jgi:DNA-binding PadR family transcriptional regulator